MNNIVEQIRFIQLSHWLVIALSLLLTFTAWSIASKQNQQKNQLQFEYNATQVVDLVKERMNKYEEALQSAVASIEASNNAINYQKWKLYSEALSIEQRYPGINGIGVIYRVKPEELPDFIAQQRLYQPDFSLHPGHDHPIKWPITFIEPIEQNLAARGLDMAHESNRFTAAKKAMMYGTPQITAPIVLVQDEEKTPGFLFYTPFYKSAGVPEASQRERDFVGLVYAPFITHKLMDGTLKREGRMVLFSIKDEQETVYDELSNIDVKNNTYSITYQIDMYGRNWSFDIYASPLFFSSINDYQPRLILYAGLTIDTLIFYVFFLLSKRAKDARNISDRISKKYEASQKEIQLRNNALEKSNKDLEQFAYIASHDLKSPLNAIQQIGEWLYEDNNEIVSPSSKRHLTLLNERVRRMQTLLDDLLKYSKVSRYDYPAQAIDLAETARELISLLDSSNRFQVTITQPCIIEAPRVPIEIILRNLIGNSIKHHHQDSGHIDIDCTESPDYYKIRVTDDGPGIHPNFHDKALEMFTTLKPRDEIEGSGMGLAMIARILDHYRGEISIQSDGKNGCTFVICWPKTQSTKVAA